MNDAGVFTLTTTDGVIGLKAGQVLVHRSLFQKTSSISSRYQIESIFILSQDE